MKYVVYQTANIRHPQAGFAYLGGGVNASGETWHLVSHELTDADASSRLDAVGATHMTVGTAPDADVDAAAPWLKRYQETRLRAEGARRLCELAGPYVREERETWPVQREEARRWLIDPAAETPMLSALAASRGITMEQMVSLVMENVTRFEGNSGAILGQQQALLTRVYDPAIALVDVLATEWPS